MIGCMATGVFADAERLVVANSGVIGREIDSALLPGVQSEVVSALRAKVTCSGILSIFSRQRMADMKVSEVETLEFLAHRAN